jgi:DNA-binding transcriptional MocR family regulator
VREKLEEIRIRNSVAEDMLSGFTLLGSSNSQFRYLLLPPGWTGQGFERAAGERGVQLFGNERFTVGNAVTSPAVRIALCSPDSLDELERGLYIIREILQA